MTERKSFITDCVKYAPGQFIPAFIGLISIPILTNIFSPEDYGQYVLILATISVLTTLSSWLTMAAIRFYPACDRDGQLEQLFTSILVALIISLLLIGGLFVMVVQKGGASFADLYQFMLIGTIVFVLTSALEVFQGFLQAQRKARWYALFSIWRAVAGLAFGIALVTMFGFGIEGLLWGSALSLALVLPHSWKLAIGRIPKIANISTELIKDMMRYSFPLVVGNLAAWILSLSDRYIIEFYRGSQEVGIYSASYAISEKSILLLVSFFLLASRPISLTLWEQDGAEKARDFISLVTRYYLLLCVPAVVGLSVLAQPVMRVLTGSEYLEGFRIVPFVALGGLLLGLQQRFQEGFIYLNKTSFLMVAIVAGGCVNVGLNLLLVPKYGYMAAAVTTMIGYVVLLAIMVLASRKYFVWDFPLKSLERAVLASTIMAAAVYPVGNNLTSSHLLNLFAAIPLGAMLYFSLLYLLGEIQLNEKRALKSLIDRLAPNLHCLQKMRR